MLPNFCPHCLAAHPGHAPCADRKIDQAVHQQYVDRDEDGAIAYYEGLRLRWAIYGDAVKRGQSLARLLYEMRLRSKSDGGTV